MSSTKSEKSDGKAQMRDNLEQFLKLTGLEKSKGWFAKQIGAETQNINDWLESGSIPAWAVFNIVNEFPGARDIFRLQPATVFGGAGMVTEQFNWYRDPKRRQLVEKVKHLVATADDSAINALLTNVDEFQKGADALRALNELKNKST